MMRAVGELGRMDRGFGCWRIGMLRGFDGARGRGFEGSEGGGK